MSLLLNLTAAKDAVKFVKSLKIRAANRWSDRVVSAGGMKGMADLEKKPLARGQRPAPLPPGRPTGGTVIARARRYEAAIPQPGSVKVLTGGRREGAMDEKWEAVHKVRSTWNWHRVSRLVRDFTD